MAHPKFVLDANVLQFSRGMQYPVERPLEVMQGIDRTASGGVEVESLGPRIKTRPLVFRNLPSEDYEALHSWYDNIADGAANVFTYYDEDGTGMAVRIMSPRIAFKKTSNGRWSGELLLEVVG